MFFVRLPGEPEWARSDRGAILLQGGGGHGASARQNAQRQVGEDRRVGPLQMDAQGQRAEHFDALHGLQLVGPRRGHRAADHPIEGGLHVLGRERRSVVESQPLPQIELERLRIQQLIVARQVGHRLARLVDRHQAGRNQLRNPLPGIRQGQPDIEAVRRRLDENDNPGATGLGAATEAGGAERQKTDSPTRCEGEIQRLPRFPLLFALFPLRADFFEALRALAFLAFLADFFFGEAFFPARFAAAFLVDFAAAFFAGRLAAAFLAGAFGAALAGAAFWAGGFGGAFGLAAMAISTSSSTSTPAATSSSSTSSISSSSVSSTSSSSSSSMS